MYISVGSDSWLGRCWKILVVQKYIYLCIIYKEVNHQSST